MTPSHLFPKRASPIMPFLERIGKNRENLFCNDSFVLLWDSYIWQLLFHSFKAISREGAHTHFPSIRLFGWENGEIVWTAFENNNKREGVTCVPFQRFLGTITKGNLLGNNNKGEATI